MEKCSSLSNAQLFVIPLTVVPLPPTRLLCPRNSPDKNSKVGSHSLLQGIFPTQGLNQGLQHCRQILYHRPTREAHSLRTPPQNECGFWMCLISKLQEVIGNLAYWEMLTLHKCVMCQGQSHYSSSPRKVHQIVLLVDAVFNCTLNVWSSKRKQLQTSKLKLWEVGLVKQHWITRFPFFLRYKLIYYNWRLITLQYCIGFATHQHESANSSHFYSRCHSMFTSHFTSRVASVKQTTLLSPSPGLGPRWGEPGTCLKCKI